MAGTRERKALPWWLMAYALHVAPASPAALCRMGAFGGVLPRVGALISYVGWTVDTWERCRTSQSAN